MQEPAFLRDIHKNHLKEYEKNRKKTVSQRLKIIREKANKLEKKSASAQNQANPI